MKLQTKKGRWLVCTMLATLMSGMLLGACGGGSESTSTPAKPTITLSPDQLTFLDKSGETNTTKVTVGDDVTWMITTELPEWLAVNAKSSKGSYDLKFTAAQDNPSAESRTVSIEIKASNAGGEATANLKVTQKGNGNIASDCYAKINRSAMLVMSYGLAFSVDNGNNAESFAYNIYEEAEYNRVKGSDDIMENLYKNDKTGSWKREIIPSSGRVEIFKDDCKPDTRYVFVSIAYDRSGKRGDVTHETDVLMTQDASESGQPQVSVKLNATIEKENHNGNDGPWYLWEVTKKTTTDCYFTYACAAPEMVETMKDYQGDYAVLSNQNGLRMAWKIFIEHKSDMMEHNPTFNKGTDAKEILYGEYKNSDRQWLSARQIDKYFQLVVWPKNSKGEWSGIIYDVVYKVNYPNIEGLTPDTPDPYTRATPTSLNFTANAYNSPKQITVESNEEWTVAKDAASWFVLSTASGSNDGQVSVSVTPNTSESQRTASITITGKSSGNKTVVTVTQAAGGSSDFGKNGYGDDKNLDDEGGTVTYTLSVQTSSLQFAAAGSTQSISLSGNDNWTATSNATSWCTVSPASGTAPGTVRVTAAKNTQTSQRTATVTIKGAKSGTTLTVSVTQAGSTGFDANGYGDDKNIDGEGVNYTLSVQTSSLQFAAAGSTQSISLSGNDSWTATSNATSWCTVSPASGTAPGTVRVTAAKNTQTSQRTATVTIKGAKSGTTLTVSIAQAGTSTFGKNDYGSDTEL